jgi:hypothetical protein
MVVTELVQPKCQLFPLGERQQLSLGNAVWAALEHLFAAKLSQFDEPKDRIPADSQGGGNLISRQHLHAFPLRHCVLRRRYASYLQTAQLVNLQQLLKL